MLNARSAVRFRSGPFGATRPASASLKRAIAWLQARRCWRTISCSSSGTLGSVLILLVPLTRTLAVTGVAERSQIRSEAGDVGPAGRIFIVQKRGASPRKFEGMSDGRTSWPGDAVRCGSHHMNCISARRAFKQGDRASSPVTDSGSSATDSSSVRMPSKRRSFSGDGRGSQSSAAGTAMEDGAGSDGSPDPAMPFGHPLMSFMAPTHDPAPDGSRRDRAASRKGSRRHSRFAARWMFLDRSSRKASNVAFVA